MKSKLKFDLIEVDKKEDLNKVVVGRNIIYPSNIVVTFKIDNIKTQEEIMIDKISRRKKLIESITWDLKIKNQIRTILQKIRKLFN